MVRAHPDPPNKHGGVAQLGEHLLCKQGVIGSIPFTSTILEGRTEGTGYCAVACVLVFLIRVVSVAL